MKLEEVKKIAKERGIQIRGLKKAEIIQAIQRNEGNKDCYYTGDSESCGQANCLWRDDCR